jgi:hypothetical protein
MARRGFVAGALTAAATAAMAATDPIGRPAEAAAAPATTYQIVLNGSMDVGVGHEIGESDLAAAVDAQPPGLIELRVPGLSPELWTWFAVVRSGSEDAVGDVTLQKLTPEGRPDGGFALKNAWASTVQTGAISVNAQDERLVTDVTIVAEAVSRL